MKKNVVVSKILVLVLVFTLAAGVQAGQRSELIGEKDLNQIEVFAQSVYDWRGKVIMTVEDDWPWYRFFTIEFRGRHDWQRIYFKVYPSYSFVTDRQLGRDSLARPADDIQNYIKSILDKSARQALQ